MIRTTIYRELVMMTFLEKFIGIRTAGNRATDLEFTRWRTTLYGAKGELQNRCKEITGTSWKVSPVSSTTVARMTCDASSVANEPGATLSSSERKRMKVNDQI